MRDTLTEETQLDATLLFCLRSFPGFSLGAAPGIRMNFGRIARTSTDLRRGEKSKITPEALPFPSTRRRDNAPPLRFVDGWATDAARRKIERNKKNARRGDGRERFGRKKRKIARFSPRQHQFYFYYRRLCVFLFFSLSLFLSLPAITSSGFVIGRRRCNRLLLFSVYARSNDSSDRAWLFFRSSSPLSYTFRTFALCASRETGFQNLNKREY